jgi:hypothetical protein
MNALPCDAWMKMYAQCRQFQIGHLGHFFRLPYHVYAKEKKEEGKKRKKRGKKERNQNFLDVGLSFTLLSTSPSMRPGIATNMFLWPLFLGNVVHPPS